MTLNELDRLAARFHLSLSDILKNGALITLILSGATEEETASYVFDELGLDWYLTYRSLHMSVN